MNSSLLFSCSAVYRCSPRHTLNRFYVDGAWSCSEAHPKTGEAVQNNIVHVQPSVRYTFPKWLNSDFTMIRAGTLWRSTSGGWRARWCALLIRCFEALSQYFWRVSADAGGSKSSEHAAWAYCCGAWLVCHHVAVCSCVQDWSHVGRSLHLTTSNLFHCGLFTRIYQGLLTLMTVASVLWQSCAKVVICRRWSALFSFRLSFRHYVNSFQVLTSHRGRLPPALLKQVFRQVQLRSFFMSLLKNIFDFKICFRFC
jgi:hypothetical protein